MYLFYLRDFFLGGSFSYPVLPADYGVAAVGEKSTLQ